MLPTSTSKIGAAKGRKGRYRRLGLVVVDLGLRLRHAVRSKMIGVLDPHTG